MGSVGFIGEDEGRPRTSNCKKKHKLSRKLLNDCTAVNYSSVPRKLRSAIKKQRCELITQPLPILREKDRVSKGVVTAKNLAKKSKLDTKKGRITKDEKEVAAILHALADLFSDATKTNEPSETKSSTIIEAGNSATAAQDTENLTKQKESTEISKKVAIEAASYSSNLVDSASKFVKVESLGDAQQCNMAIGKQSDAPVIPSDLRQKTSFLDMIPSGERAVTPAQVSTPCVQYGKRNFYPKEDRSFGTYQSPSLCNSRDLGSKTQGSCRRLPTWLENAICTSKPQVTGNNINVDKNSQVAIESKASWKRCSTHVYISRLIKVFQISEEKPSQLTTCRDVEIGGPSFSIPYQNDGLNGRNGVVSSNGVTNSGAEIQNAILFHKRLLQDQQLPFNTSVLCSSSTKQGSDFSFVGAGDCSLGDSAAINGPWNNHEAVKRLHASYLQSQNPFLHPPNGYSSAQQVQHPPFRFNSVDNNATEPFGQQFGLQQRKRPFQLQDQYNHGGIAGPDLAYWQNGGRHSSLQLNYARSLNPHGHSALGSNYQLVSPPQHFSSPQLHKNWFLATPTNL